jgi:peptide/nickel transport system substrate-binding protein
MIRRVVAAAVVVVSLSPASAPAQVAREEGTLVIANAREAGSPIPTLWGGDRANSDVSDLMFLRLAEIGPDLATSGDRGPVPRLARRWERRDPLTLVFELDPRARWHDGAPVTPADVILGFVRARDPKIDGQTATLLRRIQSVTAEAGKRVVVRFTVSYAEQLYDATYHAPPLPAHLLAAIPPESLATSAFARAPVGNGPYRWSRRIPGQVVELVANDDFFLGRPKIRRVLFLLAGEAEARVNLMLSGQADACDNIYSLPNPVRLEKLPGFRYYPIPGLTLVYINLNERDPADTSRPHPILTDPVVRQALVQAIDREGIGRATYGPFTTTPSAPVSAILGRSLDAPPPVRWDTATARRLLAGRGWADHDGDGTLDKDGRALSLSLLIPGNVLVRRTMGTQIQEAYRALGIQLKLDILDPGLYSERRKAGQFDLDFHAVGQDPSPAGLTQSWSCGGGSNVAHHCDPKVDSLMARAIVAGKQARTLWHEAVSRLAADYPAIFLAAPVLTFAVHARFERVSLRPQSPWITVWQWSVKPAAGRP